MPHFLDYEKRKRKSKKLFFILLPLLILALGLFYYWYNLNIPASNSAEADEFIIESGWGSTKISRELKDRGFIRSPLVFQFYAWSRGISSKLQDGQYLLARNLNLKDIAWVLNKGTGATKEIKLTFIEGWSNDDYADYIEEQGIGSQDEFFSIIQKKADWWDEYSVLAGRPKDRDLEGYLFPDTYRVWDTATIEEIVQKMLDNMDHRFNDGMRSDAQKLGMAIHEILTLASIIEKEGASDEDRKMISGVFHSRLEVGIGLQSDATVNYITGKNTTRPTLDDTGIDNPYNTYKYRGLPPGPICNPGLSSIMAAIYPTESDYLYFLNTPDGEVIYSKTYDEHLENKYKYY